MFVFVDATGFFLYLPPSYETLIFVDLVRKMFGIETFYEAASEASAVSGYSIRMPTAICVLGEGEKKGELFSAPIFLIGIFFACDFGMF